MVKRSNQNGLLRTPNKHKEFYVLSGSLQNIINMKDSVFPSVQTLTFNNYDKYRFAEFSMSLVMLYQHQQYITQ